MEMLIARQEDRPMRILFPVLFLAVTSLANAGWVRLATHPTAGVSYFDESSIKVVTNNIILKDLFDLNEPDAYGAKSYTALTEIDCSAGKFRLLEGQFFSGNMATGDRVWGPKPSTEWRVIEKGSLPELKAKKFCKR